MIPIYRADAINENKSVEGFLTMEVNNSTELVYVILELLDTDSEINPYYPKYTDVDPKTLSIHIPDLPNMVDIHGNKIFASLCTYGGDIVQDQYENQYLIDFRYGSIVAIYKPETRAEIEGEPRYDYLHGIDLELEIIGTYNV